MGEAGRLSYLEAMGVESYVPRLVLPGAPASELCAEPLALEAVEAVAAETGAGQNTNPESPSAPKPASAGRAAALEGLLGDLDPSAKAQPKVVAESTSQPAQPSIAEGSEKNAAPRFQLQLYRLGSWLLVDEAAPGREAELAALWKNIAFALTGQPRALEQGQRFKWPMLEGGHIDQGAQAASQTLKAYLLNQYRQQPADAVLMMSDTALSLLLEAPAGLGHWLSVDGFSHEGKPLPLLACPSAQQLLNEPSLKALMWRSLQPLRPEGE